MTASTDTKKVVLVVKDHDASRYIAVRLLAAAGYATLEAANGSEALKCAALADVIVLDVHLPDMLGYEVCRRLKSDEATAHIPVIFATATVTDPLAALVGKQLGAVAYLFSMPLDSTTFLTAVKGAIADQA